MDEIIGKSKSDYDYMGEIIGKPRIDNDYMEEINSWDIIDPGF